VIAGTEATVRLAGQLRRALGISTNPDVTIDRCYDKILMKEFLCDQGVPMTAFIPGERILSATEALAQLGGEVVVKRRIGSGGRGMVRTSQVQVLEKLSSPQVLVERAIHGVEGSVESLIQDGTICFTNVTQYIRLGCENRVPGNFSASLNSQILQLNAKVIRALKIERGLTHLEFYLLPDGSLLFGEIALRPPGGYLMPAIELAYEFDIWRAFVDIELGTQIAPLPQHARTHATSMVFHPGPGKVATIRGVEEVRNLPSLVRLKIKIKPGGTILHRQSVGEDVGYALLKNQDLHQLEVDLASLHQLLQFEQNPD
jgi:biotin carboxylase